MNKRIKITIDIDGLPEQPNYHELRKYLEERLDNAVGSALSEAFDEGTVGKDWEVHVPSF